ncbi:MAG: hypothetical protein JSU04_09145 [Bdellovibrionales bacterium]|nr:hypothetical protein [Bdellovibrionales bacterium]
MNFDDIKDNLKSQLGQTWSRIEDSSAYNQLRDRFENLTPTNQKLVLLGAGALTALLIFSIPFSYYSTSSEYVTTYEDKRSLIRELLKVTRESNEVPDLPIAPNADMLKNTIEGQLNMAKLLPEQMKGIEVMAADTGLIPKGLLESGLRVSLAKLNLRQIIDIGYNIQAISPSVKMNAINITANPEDPRYFDVEMKLVSLAVPQAHVDMPDAGDEEAGGKAKKPAFKRGNR